MKLKEYANNPKPLDESIRYEFAYLGTTDVKNLLSIKAPHYICLYSEKKSNYLMNAGFLLQQIDLYLSDSNLASCWLGMAKPSKEAHSQIRKGVPAWLRGTVEVERFSGWVESKEFIVE